MAKNCIFCKIVNGEVKNKIIHENDFVLAFGDINPQAPVHVLIVPKRHIEKISDLDQNNKEIVAELVMAANKIARKSNIADAGYRLVLNCGANAGQAVFHIHMHLLGGRRMSWPPG